MKPVLIGIAAVAIGCFAVPALADVKAGVDAWGQGDYARAVAEWQPLAAAGDPDAQFNLGQAYKLGRGVPTDMAAALEWYRKAAAQGHMRAEDNYGLLLFRQGRRDEAMPWIRKAADRGEPRAQYILGTALFNGEFVGKDWVRAYALMNRASAAGLTQASASLAQMDRYIPADQRQKGLTLAAQMESQEKTALLAADTPSVQAPARPAATAPASRPVKMAAVAPSEPAQPIAAKPIVALSSATKPAPTPEKATPAPAKTAAEPAKPTPAPPKTATESAKPVPAPPKTAAESAKSAPAKVAVPAKGGDWRVQMGAFGEEARAQALWKSLSAKVAGLSAYHSYMEKGGNVTRLQAGPLASQADAEKLCRAIKAAGTDCLVKKM